MTDPVRKPHKHAEVIKAWADGAKIEWRASWSTRWEEFSGDNTPLWLDAVEYRVKPEPHKWQKEMDAAKAGKPVQYRYGGDTPWFDWPAAGLYLDQPEVWLRSCAVFRIKPEKEVQYWRFFSDVHKRIAGPEDSNLKLTFEDGKLIGAEVLQSSDFKKCASCPQDCRNPQHCVATRREGC